MIQWLMNLLRGTPEEEDENPGKIIQGGPPRPIPNCKPRDTVVAQLILAEKDPNDRPGSLRSIALVVLKLLLMTSG